MLPIKKESLQKPVQSIGLFGYGTVGKAVYGIIQNTPGLQASIEKIGIKDPGKKRNINEGLFTAHAGEILNNTCIHTIVELIDDADVAYQIVKDALWQGKAVVTANKKMIAAHFDELWRLQKHTGTPLLYEGACCASIPIIRNLEEYYDTDTLSKIRGIINGSTNFILSRMQDDALPFTEALLQAQQLGFAETNALLDIDGHDAANKLSILLAHAFGCVIKPESLLYAGISKLHGDDVKYANQRKQKIKLVAQAQKLKNGKLAAFVLPQFIEAADELADIHNEFNGLITESHYTDKHFFKGKGAGALPTAAAVLSDIAALRYGYKYEYKKISTQNSIQLSNDYYIKVYVSADAFSKIKSHAFEYIDESQSQYGYCAVTGVILAQKLWEDTWWRQPGVSLVTCTDPITPDADYKKISRRSLELAGIT